MPPDPRFACDLAFLGNRLPDREARVEEFFLAAAERAPEQRFLLGGSGWEDKALPPNVRLARPRVDARPQCGQQQRPLRAQRQPREHGAERLVAGDPGVRGGRRRRLPDHRPLARHRDVPRARARGAGRRRRRRRRRHPARHRRGSRRAGSAPRHGAACSPSTPTGAARWRFEDALVRAADAAAAAAGSGGWPDGRPADHRPRALDHLVLGQRPRHDLARAAQGAGGTRPCDHLPRARRALVPRAPRPAARELVPDRALPRSRPSCAGASRRRGRRRCRGDRLLRAGRRRGRALGAGGRGRRGRLLRHRHARDARQARARRSRVSRARADPGLRRLLLLRRRADARAARAAVRRAARPGALLRGRSRDLPPAGAAAALRAGLSRHLQRRSPAGRRAAAGRAGAGAAGRALRRRRARSTRAASPGPPTSCARSTCRRSATRSSTTSCASR